MEKETSLEMDAVSFGGRIYRRGRFFRREFDFDEVRTADSLSKIYGVTFQALREENCQWVYGSDAYPEIEVTNIRYGYT